MGNLKDDTVTSEGTFSNLPCAPPSPETLRRSLEEAMLALKQRPQVICEPPTIVPIWLFENLADAGLICEQCGRGLNGPVGRARCAACS